MSNIIKTLSRMKVGAKKPKFKSNKATYKIQEQEDYSILRDPNRFFKNELEETKKQLFWS